MSDIKYAYPLILNKVASPHYATPTLRRARLLDWLNEAADGRATVIAADAGYGKTTLLWQWEREVSFPCYWYKLDRTDRDWTFHISYLIESISLRHKGFGRRAHSMLQQMGGPGSSRPGVTAYLLAEMHERLTTPCTFIIDDWQYVNAVTEVRGLWNQILRDAPPTCRFVFASRVKPRLQFARFKTHGGYAELRTDALRFTESEIGELFRDVYNDPLDPAELVELERRTEGWAASLQLVEFSLRECPTPEERRRFIQSITATSDSDLFDFLAEEVLDQQPDETRNFLLSTSILQQITPEVAERLAGVHDGRKELIDLEQRGLFTNRLDEVRYRYHNLFREFLERRLIAERSEAEVVGLHIHAASYFETTEQWPEAIHHYLRAGLQRQAARLIAKYGEEVVAEGRLGLVDEWLQQLPAETIKQNARLSLLHGEACGIRGDWDHALEALERARAYFNRKGDRRLEALACLKLSSVYHYVGNVEQAVSLASIGVTLVPPDDIATRLRLEGNLAVTRTWLESGVAEAALACRRVAAEASAYRYEHFAAIGFHNLGMFQHQMGDVSSAVASLQRAAAFWAGLPPNPFADNFELVIALLAQDRLAEAERAAITAMDRTERWPRAHRDAMAGRAAVLMHGGRFMDALEVLAPVIAAEADLGASTGPIAQLWLDALLLSASPASLVRIALQWLAAQHHDPRNEILIAPTRAVAVHQTTANCDGLCMEGVGATIETALSRGVVIPTVAGQLKWAWLGLEHRTSRARETAVRAMTGALDSGTAPSLRWWMRQFTGYASILARHRDGPEVLTRLVHADPDGWRQSGLAALDKLTGAARRHLLDALIACANRSTLESLRDIHGHDIAEARRLLARQFAARLYVRSLGELEIRRGGWDGPLVILGKRRIRNLFAFLVANSETRPSRDRLIDTLWPDADAISGVNSLNQSVFQLRRLLDPEHREGESAPYVFSTGDSVWLSDDLVRIDVLEIRKLHRRYLEASPYPMRTGIASSIADLIRGPFLADTRYEDWASAAATSVHAILRGILLPMANAGRTELPADAAIRAAHSMTLMDEFDEGAQVALARQLADSGRKSAARETIKRFADRLRRELDEEPEGSLSDALMSLGVNTQLTPGSPDPR